MKYFLNHFKALTQFCCVQGVPLDNNRTEGMLKIVIRNRKNAYFYKTPKGAEVSDIITSILATCLVNNVNAFDYLCYVQRNHDAAAVRPMAQAPASDTQPSAETPEREVTHRRVEYGVRHFPPPSEDGLHRRRSRRRKTVAPKVEESV